MPGHWANLWALFLVQDGWLDQIMAILLLFMLAAPFQLQGSGLWCCASDSSVKWYHGTGRGSVRVAEQLMRVTRAVCEGQFLRASLTLKDLMVLKSLMEICEHTLMNKRCQSQAGAAAVCVGADRRCGCPAGWALITQEIQCQCVPLGHAHVGWGCAGPSVQHDLPWHGQAENSH